MARNYGMRWCDMSKAHKIFSIAYIVILIVVDVMIVLSLFGITKVDSEERRQMLHLQPQPRTEIDDFLVATTFWIPRFDNSEERIIFISAVAAGIFIVGGVAEGYLAFRDKKHLSDRIRGLDGKELTPAEFLRNRNLLNQDDFTGVYILDNKTKNACYVGQGISVYRRITQHFTGHGNGDVYADWKYGDEFAIKVIPLAGSGYESLNDLERDTITAYDAFDSGYNKTHGNAR